MSKLQFIIYLLNVLLLISMSVSEDVTLDVETNNLKTLPIDSEIANVLLREKVKAYMKEGDNCEYGPIDKWDTSDVTDMSELFWNKKEYNDVTADLSKWDVSKVTNMRFMFLSANSFNSDLSKWDVSNVTNMNGMFWRASSFDSDISNWNVSKVTGMKSMFEGAKSFNSDISQWDIHRVKNTSWMFHGTTSFNQKLCWDMSHVNQMGSMISKSKGRILPLPECHAPSPFQIVSQLSSNTLNQKWCLSPFEISEDSPLSLRICSQRDTSQLWYFDKASRLRNYGNANLCISHESSDIVLKLCDTVELSSSLWMYSFNGKRIVKVQNKEKGIEVLSNKPSNTSIVKLFGYGNEPAESKVSWDLKYLSGVVLSASNQQDFRIVSRLGNDSDSHWCLTPKNNNLKKGVMVVLGKCKKWNSHHWTIDPEGKIHNKRDKSLCISYKWKRIILDSCEENKDIQKWAYNNMDKKLIPLKKVGWSVTVPNYKPSPNQFILLARDSLDSSPKTQTWEIDSIVST